MRAGVVAGVAGAGVVGGGAAGGGGEPSFGHPPVDLRRELARHYVAAALLEVLHSLL
jgi:hypothetical protein